MTKGKAISDIFTNNTRMTFGKLWIPIKLCLVLIVIVLSVIAVMHFRTPVKPLTLVTSMLDKLIKVKRSTE